MKKKVTAFAETNGLLLYSLWVHSPRKGAYTLLKCAQPIQFDSELDMYKRIKEALAYNGYKVKRLSGKEYVIEDIYYINHFNTGDRTTTLIPKSVYKGYKKRKGPAPHGKPFTPKLSDIDSETEQTDTKTC